MADFTEKAIKVSFIKLLNTKPMNKISVRDIVEACGINRNSFYYHFQDIPSLTQQIFMEETEALIQKYPTIYSLDAFVDEMWIIIKENRKVILNVFNSLSRDIFEQYTMKYCEDIIIKYINLTLGACAIDEKEKQTMIAAFKCTLFGLCVDWCSRGLEEDYMDDLHRIGRFCQDLIMSKMKEK